MAKKSSAGDRASTSFNPMGRDAAYIEPKLIPDLELLPRDDSGGPDYQPYTAQFGDGDFKQGAKAHLSARGDADDDADGDEQPSTVGARGKRAESKPPARSSKLAKE